MMGNPHRKRRKHMARHRKRRRRHFAIGNPLSVSRVLAGPKELVSMEFLTKEAVPAAVGFIAPNMVLAYLPPTFTNSTIKMFASKVLVIGALSAVAGGLTKNSKIGRSVLLGGGIALLLDVYTRFMAKGPAAPAGTSAYYGDGEPLGAYYGDNPNLGDDITLTDN